MYFFSQAIKTPIYALLITFSFLAVSKVAEAKETIAVCDERYYKHNFSLFDKSVKLRV